MENREYLNNLFDIYKNLLTEVEQVTFINYYHEDLTLSEIAENRNISAEVYDLNHFPELRKRYNVMSVPCLVIDEGRTVTFGKKNIRQLLDILKE